MVQTRRINNPYRRRWGSMAKSIDTPLFLCYTLIDRELPMPKKVKKDSKGREEEWSWEETPETIEALKKLHATKRLHEDIRKAEAEAAPDYGVGK